jgi:hypothetical protein
VSLGPGLRLQIRFAEDRTWRNNSRMCWCRPLTALLLAGGFAQALRGGTPGGPGAGPPALGAVGTNSVISSHVPAATTMVRVFTWKDVLLPEYTNYLAGLRAAGCPESHVQRIAVSDVTEYFDQRRLQQAIQADFEWWKAGAFGRALMIPSADETAQMEEIRSTLLTRFLGPERAAALKLPPFVSGANYNLTGPVLGAMPLERFVQAAEVCQRSADRLREYQMSQYSQGRPLDPVEEARLREQTRAQLSGIVSPLELEEFLLRNSHNAEALRQSLRGFDPTPEEFRKIFRALDAIQHRMQLEYGSEAALSTRQREEHQRFCNRSVQELLPPARFKAYLLTRDPSYQRAQLDAGRWGLNQQTTPRLYEFYRVQDGKRDKVNQDASLTPEQKAQAIQILAQEENKYLSDLITGKIK